MPRDKFLGDRFKVKKWKWYVVDMRDYHKPVLVRKQLDSKQQAIEFRDKYYNKDFDVVDWKTAMKYGLRDFINKNRRHKHHTAKYNYPEGCKTQYQRQLFRNVQRQKMRQLKRLPKVTETAVWEILDDKPTLLITRLKHYRDNHWAFSEPVEGLNTFKKEYEWPRDIRHLCNIVRVLKEYYDPGLYDVAQVAILIYEKWKHRIRKHYDDIRAIPKDEEKVIAEFKARGFMIKSAMEFGEEECYIESIYINPQLAHPQICWHKADDSKLYDHYIYDFHAGMSIPGFTRAQVPSLSKADLRELKKSRKW